MHKEKSSFLEFFEFATSPMREAAAYEALWDNDTASVKSISEKVFKKNFISFSSLIDPEVVDRYLKVINHKFEEMNYNIGMHFLGDAEYPDKLLDAKYPTPFIYFSGKWDLAFSPSVAIVGTRNPSPEGIKRTIQLVRNLVADNFTITSGLAAGIDTAAHQAAIDLKGNTIGVIGTPISEHYPRSNSALQKKIASEHLLISQVPFIKYDHQDYRKNRFFFPERNKTMSALTMATIIVEAGETSGSLIQAKAALEQGRKLFILDSCFHNENLTWPKKYEGMGAIRVRDYSDIINSLGSANQEFKN
ncbi:MAG: DNA-processing protein DprA [Gammaproteobacteria bacterium]